MLTNFYQLPAADTGIYLLPFAAGNFIGPFVLGPLFDSLGRRSMISITYFLSAVLLAVTGVLFLFECLTAVMQTLLWTAVFFFGSAAASSAYLTVSEVFPLEIRGVAIAIFVALGTAVRRCRGPVAVRRTHRHWLPHGDFRRIYLCGGSARGHGRDSMEIRRGCGKKTSRTRGETALDVRSPDLLGW